jgi:hypothetical protein
MRNYAWLFLSIGLTFSLVGCGDSGSSGGSGGSGGSGTMVTVTGQVTAATTGVGSGPVVADATVEVVGTSNTATTDVNGNFSIMAPTGTVLILTTTPGKPNWGSLFAENVPAGGIAGLEVEVIPDALVGDIGAALQVAPDASKGIVAVVFDEDTTVGGETAGIVADTSDISFIFNAADEPEEGNTLCGETDCGSEVIFLNVDLAATVTADAVSTAQQGCPHEFPDATYSVLEKVLTEIDVVCAVQ